MGICCCCGDDVQSKQYSSGAHIGQVLDEENIVMIVRNIMEGGVMIDVEIKNMMPKTCQSLLFSATFPSQVVEFAIHDELNSDEITR